MKPWILLILAVSVLLLEIYIPNDLRSKANDGVRASVNELGLSVEVGP